MTATGWVRRDVSILAWLPQRLWRRAGVLDEVGANRTFATVREAVAELRGAAPVGNGLGT